MSWHTAALAVPQKIDRNRGNADVAGSASGSTRLRMTRSGHFPAATWQKVFKIDR
jgi:hypothetical protein